MELPEDFLSLGRGSVSIGHVAIPNCMYSSMGYPHIEHPSKAYSNSKLDL